MPTLYTAGKAGLKTALLLNLFFLSLPSVCSAQDVLNGFFNISSVRTFPGQSKILITDFNSDSMNDFVMYGADENFVSIHRSRRGKYAPPVNKFFFYPVTEVSKFNNIIKLGNFYFFISRKMRLAGLFEFSPYGTLQLMHRKKLNSFPSGFAVSDYDLDGSMEAAVFGPNYNGISLIKQENFKLREEQFGKGKLFAFAGFADFDYNGYPDLYAFDLLENKFEIYSNNTSGGLEFERDIQLITKPDYLIVDDMNNDGFYDIVYSYRNGLDVLIGDSVSEFSEADFIPTDGVPKNFLLADFNADSEKDLAYTVNRGLFISFSRHGDFSDAVEYMADSSLSDIKVNRNENGTELFALSVDGKFTTVSNITYSDGERFSPPGRLSAFEFLDLEGDRDIDFCYIDSANSKLDFLFNQNNQPMYLLREKLVLPQRKILVSQFSENEKIVLAYSEGRQLFEIVWVNEKTKEIRSGNYYAPGKIRQLLIDNREADQQFYVSGLYTAGDSLMYFTYFLQDYDLYPDEIEYIGKSSLTSQMVFSNGVKLYTAESFSDTLHLTRFDFGVRVYSMENAFVKMDQTPDSNSAVSIHKFHLPRSLNDIVTARVGDESVIYDFYSDIRIFPERLRKLNGISTKDILEASRINSSNNAVDIYIESEQRIKHYEYSGGKFRLKKKFIVSGKTDNYFSGKFSNDLNALVYFDTQLNTVVFQEIND